MVKAGYYYERMVSYYGIAKMPPTVSAVDYPALVILEDMMVSGRNQIANGTVCDVI